MQENRNNQIRNQREIRDKVENKKIQYSRDS